MVEVEYMVVEEDVEYVVAVEVEVEVEVVGGGGGGGGGLNWAAGVTHQEASPYCANSVYRTWYSHTHTHAHIAALRCNSIARICIAASHADDFPSRLASEKRFSTFFFAVG